MGGSTAMKKGGLLLASLTVSAQYFCFVLCECISFLSIIGNKNATRQHTRHNKGFISHILLGCDVNGV